MILKKEHQGKGYAKAILKKIIDFAFNRMNLHRLEAEVIETNKRSRKIIESLGFIFEGELREAKYQNGKYISVLRYGLLKYEFVKREKNK
ncbi:MAG: GNAT family protein [Ignavibacteria bacterium]